MLPTKELRYNMFRYVLFTRFDGTAYHGWAKQPNALTVQQTLEDALTLLLKKNIETTGAGRTDSGVHARLLPVHFDLNAPLSNPEQLEFRLNRILPRDISILGLFPVPQEFHARFSAIRRQYIYRFGLVKNPFIRPYVWEICRQPDWNRMMEAAKHLEEVESFASFCRSHADSKTFICKQLKTAWDFQPETVAFHISADRFLRNMVRAVVGTLMDIGYGKMSIEEFKQVVAAGDRRLAGASAPASGLTLENVLYPEHFSQFFIKSDNLNV